MSGGTVLVERDGMFARIVNSPDRLRWGYHEQSYRMNRIQQKKKHGSFMQKLWFSKRLKNIVSENDARRSERS
jgi:hypothetical protein